jgi:hypothetical protein
MTALSPIATSFSPMQYAPSASAILLFDCDDFPAYENFANSTYSWTGTNWSLLASGSYTAPVIRNATAMAYDTTSSSMILFGGKGQQMTGYLNDVWSATTGTAWTQQIANHAATGPAIRGNHMMCAMSTGAVLFGGLSLFPWIYQDLWLYASGVWTNLIPTTLTPTLTSPSVRWNAAFASNAAGGAGTTAVLFGGQNEFNLLNDLWILTSVSTAGGTWTQATIAAGVQPSCRSGAAMCWVQASNYWLLYGGVDACGSTLGDTWSMTLSGTTATWTLLNAGLTNTATSPAFATGCQLASDGSTNTILMGGKTSKLNLNTTFKWSAGTNTWAQQ